jgi:hypothetical protein
MGEFERRRRRVRPASSTAAPIPDEPPVESTMPVADPIAEPATEPVEEPVAEPVEEVEPVPRPPRSPMGRRPSPVPGGPGPGAPGGDERESERGLRGLVGSGSSQVSVGAALRARDAARPTEADLADADANLTIVRRNWTPREELPRNR